MLGKYVGTIISYKNGPVIKEAIVYDFDEKYPLFLKVVNHPIESNLNKRMILLSETQKKVFPREISKSGDWAINREITKSERKALDVLLNKK